MEIKSLFRNLFPRKMQQPVALAGNYESTKGDNRNVFGWVPNDGSANQNLIDDLPTLRSQSRDLARNSTIGSGAIRTSVTNTVGTGMKPQSRIMRPFLRLTDEAANQWQKDIENLFWLWADSKYADVTGTNNFWQLQRLVFRSDLESGDCFIVRRFLNRGGILGLTLQVVEADRVCNPNRMPDTDKIVAGIERNENGEPVKYHIANKNPLDISGGPVSWVAVDAKDVIHVFDRLRPDQSRGIPFLAGVIEQLKQLQRLTEAELTASVVTSKLALVVTSEKQAGVPVLPGQLPGQVNTSSGVTVNGSAPIAPPGTNVAKFGSGSIVEVEPGEDVKNLTPTRPNAAFSPFFEAIVRQVGVSLGIPYEVLILYYSSSYTSARASQLDSKKTWENNVEFMSHMFNNIVWGWFLEEAIARNLISAPGFFQSPITRMAYSMVQWSGPAMGSLNPSVEADADFKNMSMGIDTLQNICQAKGGDWQENLQQRKQELEMQWNMPYIVNPSMIGSPIGPNGQVMSGGGTGSAGVKLDDPEDDSDDNDEDDEITENGTSEET